MMMLLLDAKFRIALEAVFIWILAFGVGNEFFLHATNISFVFFFFSSNELWYWCRQTAKNFEWEKSTHDHQLSRTIEKKNIRIVQFLFYVFFFNSIFIDQTHCTHADGLGSKWIRKFYIESGELSSILYRMILITKRYRAAYQMRKIHFNWTVYGFAVESSPQVQTVEFFHILAPTHRDKMKRNICGPWIRMKTAK